MNHTKRMASLLLALVMMLLIVPSANASTTYDYAINDGIIRFDPTTGAIVGWSGNIYDIDIPSEIYGVPVKKIGERAFKNCHKLQRVTLPSSVTEIGDYAFYYCSLEEINIPDSVTQIGAHAFAGTNLTSITVPGSVKTIGNAAFMGAKSLTSVTLQEGVEKLGKSVFSNCTGLESITLPDSLQEIGSSAFMNSSLSSVTFGTGLKYIDIQAFLCPISELWFRGDAPSVGTYQGVGRKIYPFKTTNNPIIYYPEGASGWTTPTWNGIITKSYKLETPEPASAAEKVTAMPSDSGVVVNGQEVAFDAYSINQSDYFKLRDLALILSGSNVQFNVTWDKTLGGISLTSGQPYTPVGGEMSGKGSINQVGTLNTSKIYLNGSPVDLTAYTIQGNNYFNLRDIGALFNFSVEWDSASQKIIVDTSKPYVEG